MMQRENKLEGPLLRIHAGLSTVPHWVWLSLAGLFLFLFRAGLPLTDGDSAFYAVIARNMLEDNNWQTLRYTDTYGLVDKPPLTLWLISLSYMLLGINEVAIRGWHALMSVGTILLVYATAKLFYGRTVAALSGWLLLSAALFAYSGFVPQQDIPLTFFSTLAFYGLARFLLGHGAAYTYVSWAALALGFLTRGPQGAMFPMLVAIFVLYGAWRQSGSPRPTKPLFMTIGGHLLPGATLFAAITAPWFIREYMLHGWPIIDLLLGTGQARFFENMNRGPDILRFWSYFPLLIVACLPWSGLIGHGIVAALRHGRQPNTSAADNTDNLGLQQTGNRLFLAWFFVAFFLPFLTQWRVIRYLLPAIPALAVLVALYLAPLFETVKAVESQDYTTKRNDMPDAGRSAQRGLRFVAWMSLLIVVPVLLLIIAVYAQAFPDEQAAFGKLLTPFLLAIAIGIGGFVIFTWCRRYHQAVVTLFVGSFAAYAVLFATFGQHAEMVLPGYAAANVVNTSPGDTVIWMADGHDPFVEFYVRKPLIPRTQLDAAMTAAAARGESVLLMGDTASVENALKVNTGGADIVWQQDQILIARVLPAMPHEGE